MSYTHFSRLILKSILNFQMKKFSQGRYSGFHGTKLMATAWMAFQLFGVIVPTRFRGVEREAQIDFYL